MTRVGHLAARFAGSLRARPLDRADLAFVRQYLPPEELDCWERLGSADRAESLATARTALVKNRLVVALPKRRVDLSI